MSALLRSLRGGAKRAAEWSLASPPVLRVGAWSRRDRVLVLAYHNVLPDGMEPDGDRPLHLPRQEFAAQLDLLAAECDVVPLADLARPSGSRRPRAVITLDDAYVGAMTAGVAELAARGLPATVFVAPGLSGRADGWWDACDPAGAQPDFREVVLARCGGRDAEARALCLAGGGAIRTFGEPYSFATEQLLAAAAAAHPGLTYGAHGWSHAALPALDDDSLAAELSATRDWLAARFERTVPWLAYPYGLGDERVERAARAAGFAGAFRVLGGWTPRGEANPYALPRLNVPCGLSRDGFALRVAGLFAA